jgi:hypothetical protein
MKLNQVTEIQPGVVMWIKKAFMYAHTGYALLQEGRRRLLWLLC